MGLLVAAAACAASALFALAYVREGPRRSAVPSFPPPAGQARRLLAALTVAPRRGLAGYRRDAFGSGLLGVAVPRIRYDPYTGADTRGWVELDHLVPLAEAWRSGAADWPAAERVRFAGDGDELLAVGGAANRDKGGRGPDRWRPRHAYWCEYARRWIAIKARYSLHVTAAEHRALTGMLAVCVE
jgi:hypothetical protein